MATDGQLRDLSSFLDNANKAQHAYIAAFWLAHAAMQDPTCEVAFRDMANKNETTLSPSVSKSIGLDNVDAFWLDPTTYTSVFQNGYLSWQFIDLQYLNKPLKKDIITQLELRNDEEIIYFSGCCTLRKEAKDIHQHFLQLSPKEFLAKYDADLNLFDYGYVSYNINVVC